MKSVLQMNKKELKKLSEEQIKELVKKDLENIINQDKNLTGVKIDIKFMDLKSENLKYKSI